MIDSEEKDESIDVQKESLEDLENFDSAVNFYQDMKKTLDDPDFNLILL